MSKLGRQLPVFVYGTLRHGESNYHLLAGRTTAELPATMDNVAMYAISNYPILNEGYRVVPILTEGQNTVRGELMTLDPNRYDAIMADLDILESYDPGRRDDDNLYLRLQRPSKLADGSIVMAWVYFGNLFALRTIAAQRTLIKHGDWTRYIQEMA
jgi:gamma-glutamylcyclotransferase (GGCT)/AIG2-like uncharacterized protein YtfP